jgi:DedD protein
VGAGVLLLAGVIGFPLLFETQPRPLPVDTPIEVRPRELAAAPTLPPAPTPRSTAVPAPPPDAVSEAPVTAPSDTAAALRTGDPANEVDARGVASTPAIAASAAAPAAPRPSADSVDRPVPAATQQPSPAATQPPAAPAARPDDGGRARALLEGGASAPTAGRFVVQVGAYSDPGALRQARQRVEKLGLQTYTQVVNTAAGPRTRVRIGPYASREQADAAAARVKAAGLPAAILVL